MLAVDTNIVVRYLLKEQTDQTDHAISLIETNVIFVPLTVILETEWVLRDVYGIRRRDLVNALGEFARLPTVPVEELSRLNKALKWTTSGLDFADALHLAGAHQCTAFVTFDKAMIKAAKAMPLPVVRAP